MRVLIIGGTGNISRWFTETLITRGYEIVLYNRGNKQLFTAPNVQYITGDRTDYVAFAKQMDAAGIFDCVVDMVGYEPADATQAVEVFSGKTKQFIFCSTVDVYSKQQISYPVSPEQPITAAESFSYAYKKVQIEKTLWSAFEQSGFPLTVLRLAATYSEGWSPLVTCFGGGTYHLDRLQKGLPVILHGDGSAIWAATHSSDAAVAFVNAIGNSNTIGKAYNVTGDELLTWRSMHQVVAQALGAPSPDFVYIPTTILQKLAPAESEWCVENFQYDNIFDNLTAKDDLGFSYTVSYKEGVERCIRFLREHNGIEDASNHAFYDRLLQRWNTAVANL